MQSELETTIANKLADAIVEQNAALGDFRFLLGPAKLPEQDAYVTAAIAYDRSGNKLPYLSITGTVYRSKRMSGRAFDASIRMDGMDYYAAESGVVHEQIAATFPQLRPFLRWHMTFADGPMHYVANAVYWAQVAYGVAENPPRAGEHGGSEAAARAAFDATVVLGSAASSEHADLAPFVAFDYFEKDVQKHRAQVRSDVTAWCLERRGRMLYAFQRDLQELRALGSAS